MVRSYGKIYNLGHRRIKELFETEIEITEKVDGSQFSFGKFDGILKCRSKGKEIILDNPDKMFLKAVEVVEALDSLYGLKDGWTYRCEYLNKPKHNVLCYDRVPENNLIVFNIDQGMEDYLSHEDMQKEVNRLRLEIVPCIYRGKIDGKESLTILLDRMSILGGQKIEGIVIKNYNKFVDDKMMMGKYVSEAFKEVHNKDWKLRNPNKKDMIDALIEKYKTVARWNKGIQHLLEKGELENSPKDIGKLIKEIQGDTKEECEDGIKEMLFNWAWPQIQRGVIGGFPEYYKEKLLGDQFDVEESS